MVANHGETAVATLIRTPARSGITRQLSGTATAAPARVSERGRNEAPLHLTPVMGSADAGTERTISESAAVRPAADGSVADRAALPTYDADTFASMLKRANERAEKAERELAGLKAGLLKISNDAQAQGYAEGEAQGRATLNDEAVKLRADFQALLAAVQGEIAKLLADAEESLVEIAYAAVCRVIGAAVVQREGVVELIRTASQSVLHNQEIVIHISQHDHELLGDAVDTALHDRAGSRYRIVADNRVKLGGCILETATGSLDARLEVQLQRLKEALVNAHMQSLTDG